MRRMDCMDCHNRPSHITCRRHGGGSSPSRRDASDRPALHQEAWRSRRWCSRTTPTPRPMQGIEQLHPGLLQEGISGRGQGLRASACEPAVEEVKRVYQQNFFPEMKVNWEAYPDNIGHKDFPGCFRCHDGKHVTKEGRPLTMSCALPRLPPGQRRRACSVSRPRRLSPIRGSSAASTPGSCATRATRAAPRSRPPAAAVIRSARRARHGQPDVQPVPSKRPAAPPAGELHDLPRGARRPAQGGDPFQGRLYHVPRPTRRAPAPRETCLTCHADRAQHNPGQACAQCHAFRAKGAAAGPPAITFPSAGSPGPVTFTHATHLAPRSQVRRLPSGPVQDAEGRRLAHDGCHGRGRPAGPATTARRPSRSWTGTSAPPVIAPDGKRGGQVVEPDGAPRPRRLRYNGGMSEAIVVTDTVRVPPWALTVHAVRASGPGGQNVNKLATKIDLRVDLGAVEGLSDAARARLRGPPTGWTPRPAGGDEPGDPQSDPQPRGRPGAGRRPVPGRPCPAASAREHGADRPR